MIVSRPPTWTRGGWARDARTGEYRHPTKGIVSRVGPMWTWEVPRRLRRVAKVAVLTMRTRFDCITAADRVAEHQKKGRK